MITYQLSVTQGFPLPCTEDIWNEIIDRPAVKNICDQITALDPEAPDFNDRKQALKRRLPIIIPHGDYADGRELADILASQVEQMGENLCEMDMTKVVEAIRNLKK